MNVVQLPDDILIVIVDEMNNNIFSVSMVNKELHRISKNRIKKEREKYDRKIAFYAKCSNEGTTNFIYNAFHGVVTLEDCDFLYERYVPFYGFRSFISRIKYTMGNTYQIPAETWAMYLKIHDIQARKSIES